MKSFVAMHITNKTPTQFRQSCEPSPLVVAVGGTSDSVRLRKRSEVAINSDDPRLIRLFVSCGNGQFFGHLSELRRSFLHHAISLGKQIFISNLASGWE